MRNPELARQIKALVGRSRYRGEKAGLVAE